MAALPAHQAGGGIWRQGLGTSGWTRGIPCSPGTESQETVNGGVNSHPNEAQRELLAALEPVNDEDAGVGEKAVKTRGGKEKPLRHQLQRTPAQAQQPVGRRYSRPGTRDSPRGPLPGSWECPGAP